MVPGSFLILGLLLFFFPLLLTMVDSSPTCPYTVPCTTNATLVIDSHAVSNDNCTIRTSNVTCNSLVYGLDNVVKKAPETSWLILIVNDQIVNTPNISIRSHHCTVICGVNAAGRAPSVKVPFNVHTMLYLKTWDSYHTNPSTNQTLAILNLAFDEHDSFRSQSVFIMDFHHVFLSYLTVVRANSWTITHANDITFTNSTFHNYSGLSLDASVSVTLTNLTLDTIYGGSPVSIISGNTASDSKIAITNCTVINGNMITTEHRAYSAAAFSIILHQPGNVTITNTIVANITSYVPRPIFYMGLSPGADVLVYNTSFHDNILSKISDAVLYVEERDSCKSDILNKTIYLEFSQMCTFFRNMGTLIDFNCNNCDIGLFDSIFFENYGKILQSSQVYLSMSNLSVSSTRNELFSDIALFEVENSIISISDNVTIQDNIGTPFKLMQTQVSSNTNQGDLYLVNNTGKYGGGIFVNDLSYTLLSNKRLLRQVHIINNTAIFGGAIYIDSSSSLTNCYSLVQNLTNTTIIFQYKNNKAITKGNTILIDYGITQPSNITYCIDHNISTLYFDIDVKSLGDMHMTLFPGQLIKFQVNSTEICQATLYVTCEDGDVSLCHSDISLNGSVNVMIPKGNNIITVDLTINLDITRYNNKSLWLHVFCLTVKSTIPMKMKTCPLGFTLDNSNRSCLNCPHSQCDPTLYQSSLEDGVACVHKNYWYGTITGSDTVIDRCFFPFCDTNRGPCPFKTDQPYTFIKLPDSENEQCLFNKGGVLCRKCKDGYKFTYLGLKCVKDDNHCEWHLVWLIVLAVIINLFIGLLWVVVMRFKGGLTFGVSLGPLLFIALVKRIPFGAYEAFKSIEMIYFTLSLLIFDNSILGYIPVCTPITTGVGQNALNYIGPLVIIVMMAVIIFASYCCPRYLHRITGSYLQMICLLGLVTFWSLASTSINLILPLKLGDSYRFAIDPNVPINSYYTLVWLISIPVLILVLTIVVFMTVSPYLSKCFNTLRIKPILDVSQSCYKDKWRWYSMIYFTVWMVITPLTTYNVPSLFVQCLILGILTIQFLFRPYAFQWLNTIDTLLLLDLLVLFSFLGEGKNIETFDFKSQIPFSRIMSMFYIGVVYILAMLPIIGYIIFGLVVMARFSKASYLEKCSEREPIDAANGREDDDYGRDVHQSLMDSQRHEIGRLRDES